MPKFAGVMSIGQLFLPYLHHTLPRLVEFCDGPVTLVTYEVDLDQLRDKLRDMHIGGLLIEEMGPVYRVDRLMVDCYAAGRKSKPDWVVSPDMDEILPFQHLADELNAVDQQHSCVMFRMVNCIDDPETVLTVHQPQSHGPHVRCYRGDIDDFKYGWFHVPHGHEQKVTQSKYPLRHLYLMTDTLRAWRKTNRNQQVYNWRSMPFDPDWTVDDWKRRSPK